MSVEDSPEFKKALQEACETQYRGFLYGGNIPKSKVGDTEEEIQRQRAELDEKLIVARKRIDQVRKNAELMSNPHAREITQNLSRKHSGNPVEDNLICPKCLTTDSHGNTMNGKPFCFRCQLPFMSKEKAEKWAKPQKPKPKNYTFNDYERVTFKK